MYADTEQAELATWEHDERVAAGMEPDGRAVAHLPLRWALSGEILGTYLLVLFGTGAVAAQVLTKAQIGLWQVTMVWGFALPCRSMYPERSPALKGRPHPGHRRQNPEP